MAKTQDMVGKTVRVLVEEHASRDNAYLLGTADNTRSVRFEGDDELIGKFVNVLVNKAVSPHLVEGQMVEILG